MNPTREQVAQWLAIAGDLTASELTRQLAVSNVVAAFAQLQASVEVLRKELEARPKFQLISGGRP